MGSTNNAKFMVLSQRERGGDTQKRTDDYGNALSLRGIALYKQKVPVSIPSILR